jgi:hypothetical protein
MKYFNRHGRLSQSEERKCLLTQDKDGVTIEFMKGVIIFWTNSLHMIKK